MAVEKGYIFESLPKSTKEAASKFSLKRIKTLAKTSLQSYIDSFLNSEKHVNRRMLEAAAGKIQYFSDLTFTADPANAKIEKPIQLARMYTDLKENFPCILIVDAGAIPRQYAGSRIPNKRTANLESQLEYVVPLTVSVASLDEETTDILSSLLSLIFGPLLVLAGGVELKGNIYNGDKWTVKLPNVYTWSALSQSNIEGDSKDQIWSSTFELEVTVEDTLEISIHDFVEACVSLKVDDGSGIGVSPTIFFPDSIQINTQEKIVVTDLQTKHNIVLDNPRNATFDPETFMLTPKFPGVFNIMILDGANNIVAKKEVTITL